MGSSTTLHRLRRSGAVLLILGLILGMVGAFAGTAGAAISPSTFEGNDGNLVVNGAGAKDWVSVQNDPEFVSQPDLTNENSSNTDNSYVQGAKEDDPTPTVEFGSIPPSKDDFSGAYLDHEQIGGEDFLYIAWKRTKDNGDAHIGFEFNQSQTMTANGVNRVRTAGDLLISYDFDKGGNVSTIFLRRWVASGPKALCDSANSTPCWSPATNLTAIGEAEAKVNDVAVTDLDGSTLPIRTFGEASINLTTAGILSRTTCTSFVGALVKSRASTSFTAELKDLIGPIGFPFSNCGRLTIVKDAQPDSSQAFSFRTSGATTDTAYNLTDNGTDPSLKSKSFTLFAGDYTTTETVPSEWSLDSVTCVDASAPGTPIGTAVTNGKTVAITPDSDITCTFVNKAVPPDVRVRKSANPAGPVNAGDNIGFDIVVDNIGSGTATSVSLTDTLPTTAGTNWSISPAVTGCSISGGVLTCNRASLAPGASFTVHLSSPTTAASCGTVNNNATVSASNEPSTVLANNSASASVVVNCGDIHINKTADPAGPVLAGDNIGFTIDVWKTGAGDVTSVTVHDTLPTDAGTTWTVGGPDAAACDIANGELTCDFGTITSNDTTKTVSLSSPTTAATCGVVENTARVTTGNDGDGSSNASVTVTCPPDVTISKAGNGPLTAGQGAVWTIGVTNNGPGEATSVTVSDTLPAGITWTLGGDDAADCSITAGVLSCDFGTLAAGATRTVTLTGTTNTGSCPSIRNTATVSASNELPADQGNNSASATINVTCPPPPPPPPPPPTTTTEAPTTTTTQPPQVLPEVIEATTTTTEVPTTTTTIKVLGVQLARTGSDTGLWLRLAGMFLIAGGLLVMASDRRVWFVIRRR